MPINEALFAAMKAASYIQAQRGQVVQIAARGGRAYRQAGTRQSEMPCRGRLRAYGGWICRTIASVHAAGRLWSALPEALEESSANGTPVASAISAILPAVLPKVLPKILIKESTSSGNADGISGNANTELPSVTPRGTILFFHGGGWTTGGINLYTQACAHMAVRLQRRVISVEYRLAPEYRFPTAVEDCYEVARQLFAGELPISGVGGGTVAAR